MTDQPPAARIAPCVGYEASDDAYLTDLPGLWDASDFLGGDPDERSFAERHGVVVWGNPQPILLEARNVSLETLEIATGLPLIPLAHRTLPAEGTE